MHEACSDPPMLTSAATGFCGGSSVHTGMEVFIGFRSSGYRWRAHRIFQGCNTEEAICLRMHFMAGGFASTLAPDENAQVRKHLRMR